MTPANLIEIFLLLIIAIGVIATYRRTRAAHRDMAGLRDHADTVFHQTEALIGLYRLLDGLPALPATRGWAGSPDFLAMLAKWSLEHRPVTVVECGSGVSTLVLATCARRNGAGHVYSLEHEAGHAQATRDELQRHGLADWATVIDAPLKTHHLANADWTWYDDAALPAQPIDLLIVDGPPRKTQALARYPAGPRLFGRLATPAVVFLDDAARDDERAIVARWTREFPELTVRTVPLEKGVALLHRA